MREGMIGRRGEKRKIDWEEWKMVGWEEEKGEERREGEYSIRIVYNTNT